MNVDNYGDVLGGEKIPKLDISLKLARTSFKNLISC